MENTQEHQIIYGFQTKVAGSATSYFNITYEDKQDLIKFITTKGAIVKTSTFIMHGSNDNRFIEMPDDENEQSVRILTVFEMKLFKKKQNETN